MSLLLRSKFNLSKVRAFATHSNGPQEANLAFPEVRTPYEMIIAERAGVNHNVALAKLNNPNAMNALCSKLIMELGDFLIRADHADYIAAIVITGNNEQKAFSSGIDVNEMSDKTFEQVWNGAYLESAARVLSQMKKPVIAGACGYCVGGGLELFEKCDIRWCGDNALFGHVEVKLGTIPGGGGTQLLPRIVGLSKAMEMLLTGDTINAEEALRCGLVSRVLPVDQVVTEAVKLAEKIGKNPALAVKMAKECARFAYDHNLHEGLQFERRMFHATFATSDMREGMNAFVQKRKPK